MKQATKYCPHPPKKIIQPIIKMHTAPQMSLHIYKFAASQRSCFQELERYSHIGCEFGLVITGVSNLKVADSA
jgi:hypothetical protein